MTNHRLMLRDALLALPIVIGIGFWFYGAWGATGVLLSGLATVANLWVIMMLTYRLTSALDDEGGSLALIGGLALLKVPVALVVYTVIAQFFGLMSAFMGLLILLAPVIYRGLQFLVQTPIPSNEMDLGSSK